MEPSGTQAIKRSRGAMERPPSATGVFSMPMLQQRQLVCTSDRSLERRKNVRRERALRKGFWKAGTIRKLLLKCNAQQVSPERRKGFLVAAAAEQSPSRVGEQNGLRTANAEVAGRSNGAGDTTINKRMLLKRDHCCRRQRRRRRACFTAYGLTMSAGDTVSRLRVGVCRPLVGGGRRREPRHRCAQQLCQRRATVAFC